MRRSFSVWRTGGRALSRQHRAREQRAHAVVADAWSRRGVDRERSPCEQGRSDLRQRGFARLLTAASLPNSDGLCRSRRGRASTQNFPRGGRPDQTGMSMIRRSLRCAGGRSVTGSARWTSGPSVRFRHTAGRTAKRHMQGALSPLDRPLGRATRRRSQVRTEPSLVG